MVDLLQRTAALMAIPSLSLDEGRLADHVQADLSGISWLEVERYQDNVIARTHLDRPFRLVLAGHLDTVPPDGNATPRIDGDTLWGLGAADMKGGLAVMLELARAAPADLAVDITWVFYAAEEIKAEHNGLRHLFNDRPDLVRGDAAILGEPTGGAVEAGCQGSMRVELELAGKRAHTARPWMGVNALHRAGQVLNILAAYEPRHPVIDGCEFREAIQAVALHGGVAGNVVPDQALLTMNLRFAPDRTAEETEAHLLELVGPVLQPDDKVQVVDVALAAAPGLDHPLLATLRDRNKLGVRAKLGWTDVARFAAAGIPAVNFGPGDSALAHNAEERVERTDLDRVYAALSDLLKVGAGE